MNHLDTRHLLLAQPVITACTVLCKTPFHFRCLKSVLLMTYAIMEETLAYTWEQCIFQDGCQAGSSRWRRKSVTPQTEELVKSPDVK